MQIFVNSMNFSLDNGKFVREILFLINTGSNNSYVFFLNFATHFRDLSFHQQVEVHILIKSYL